MLDSGGSKRRYLFETPYVEKGPPYQKQNAVKNRNDESRDQLDNLDNRNLVCEGTPMRGDFLLPPPVLGDVGASSMPIITLL